MALTSYKCIECHNKTTKNTEKKNIDICYLVQENYLAYVNIQMQIIALLLFAFVIFFYLLE